MRCRDVLCFALVAGCGSAMPAGPRVDGSIVGLDPSGDDLSLTLADLAGLPDGMPSGDNVLPMIVDSGPAALSYSSYNVGFVTVQVCAPGSTTNCAMIDHVSVDSGSVGFRVLSSAIPATVRSALPAANDGSGHPLGECYVFADGYVWGSVRLGDLVLGGERAPSLPFQLIGDPGLTTVPGNCKNTGAAEDTLDGFGANGIIGLAQYAPDCGDYCEDAADFGSGYQYYGCATPTTCAQVVLPSAQQVQNPIALLPADNNGVVVQLPAIDPLGAASPVGSLILGIGTQANNALSSATIFTIGDEDSDGSITVKMNGHTYADGYFDSGTTDLTFDQSGLPTCGSAEPDRLCPSPAADLTAQNVDAASVPHAVAIHVESADTLYNGPDVDTAFDDIAANAGDSTTFAWGMPFFYGRSVYFALEGKSTPGGAGPYFAY